MAKCLTPYQVKNKMTNETQPVACGKCPECLARRASGWSFRLMQEEKRSTSAHFITLTYDTTYVPISKNGFMSLNRRDVQLFIKRLRKQHDTKLKYYAVGEYGGITSRPHYHLILFNADISKIQPAWQRGSVHYGTVNGATVGYTLKYMSKPKRIPMHRNDDRVQEFGLMSKGLGENYITQKMVKWHKKDLANRMYVNIEDGKKIAMPRYYKDKIYHEQERKAIAYWAKKTNEQREQQMVAAGTLPTARDKAEKDKESFAKMYHNATKGRNKI